MSRNIEEEEEEEEEDEEPVTLRKGTGFKMVTSLAPSVNQSVTETMSTVDGSHTEIVHETHTESHEVIIPQGQTPDSAEARAQADLQAKFIAEQKEAMERAQQEALQRAQLAQQQAIKEAQERAQREAQMRVQQAQAEAKAKQAEVEAKARQAEAEAKAKQAQAEAKKRAEQEALQRAQREAQIKAEQERAEQLRAQQQAKIAAARQAQQVQVQAQKSQENQPPNVQRQQQKMQQPNQQQPQMTTKQPQMQASKYQAPIKQVQQQTPQQQQQQQKKGPTVPAKPGQTPITRQNAPLETAAVRGGPPGHKLSAGGVLQAQASPAFSQQQIIPNTGDKIHAMRGGDVQQAYLNNITKPAEILPQHDIKPIHTQEDQSWVTQNRIPVEIQAPQPAKITIPELHGSVEVKPTVIIPRPAQTTRVEWNEFPQEETKELIEAPRVKVGDWHPDHQSEIIGAHSVKSAYQPGRIGHVWPPPQNENIAPRQEVTITKTTEDTAWRRDEKAGVETGTAWGKSIPHNLQKVWPPPENEVRTDRLVGSRLQTIQWPPPEFEQQIQQDVDILQTRLPVKPNRRQWPPPPPEYGPVIEQDETVMEQKVATGKAPAQQMQKKTTTTVTKGMVHVGGAR
uniref:Microtubule-associated protein n=1 Tax=Elaeophora elaphi TaxID=1147741 RepID=A0A0R3RKC4_9BILA